MPAIRYNLAILDSDVSYAMKLMEFINQRQPTAFSASVFSHFSKYLAYVEQNRVDILICGDEYAKGAVPGFQEASGCIIYLSKTRDADTAEQSFLYKYQSAVLLYESILSMYRTSKRQDAGLEACRQTEILGMIPIFEQEACFYFGVLAADYSSRNGNTLYISFDPFFSPSLFGIEKDCCAVTDSISRIRVRSIPMEERLHAGLIEAGNCTIFGGCVHWADCTEIEAEEAAELVRVMLKHKQYHRIVIDFGGLYRMSGGLIKLCTKLYMPKPQNAYGAERMRIFQKQADRTDMQMDGSISLVPLDGIQMELFTASAKRNPASTRPAASSMDVLRSSRLMELVKAYV